MRHARFHTITIISGVLLVGACRPAAPPVTPQPATKPAVKPIDLTPRVVPQPASLTRGAGAPFVVTATTGIVVDGAGQVQPIGETLAMLLRKSTSFPVLVSQSSGGTAASGTIRLRLANDRQSLGEEGYELTVTSDSVVLVAYRPAGLFHGVQTIRQLLPAAIESEIGLERDWAIPALTIADQPRFPWRGGMIDVGRHFLTVREVQQFIDLLALYKMNVLHIHLTDDQGWRIQINSRPKLTAVGSLSQMGGGTGGFFTQQDYTDIVRYAQARYITVVPEIEMPGHSWAALTTYPELTCKPRPPDPYTGPDLGWSALCPDKEVTYAYIDDVIKEVAALTPGPYLHIGGDEVASLSDSQYVKFIQRAQDIVNKYGKTMIGWEEITKAKLKPATIAQMWKSDSVTAALSYGSKLILSPATHAYLDMQYTPETELGLHWSGYVEVRDAYDWNPLTFATGLTESNVLGIEAPIWGETVRSIGAVNYMSVPRLPALAEVGWTPQAARDWEGFRSRIAAHAPRWRYLGVNYYPSPQIPW
ncbi:MAG TPA: beta-N-acetylhexosaminidase [Gemmatimonadaceae bacterium]|nr:beta-N-acetylhexosaminidase [Gemmatimonadaceae bacterium]